MKKTLLMAALAAAVVVMFGCGGDSGADLDSDGRTWYCGTEKKPRALRATLKNGTLTVSGKGAMRDYYEPRGCIRDGADYEKVLKEWHSGSWPPWYFAVVYDSTVSITDVVIENGVTYIGNLAFSWLTGLKSITIPASVSSIGDVALGGCGVDCDMVWDDTCVSRPPSLTVAANNPHYSFEDGILFNKNKTTLLQYRRDGQQDTYTIPNSVKAIGYGAFARCNSLTSIIIPNSVTSIGNSAFSQCQGLTLITIPGSVKTIGRVAFAHCYKLKSITVQTPIPPSLFGKDVFERINANACLYVPKGSIDAYRAANTWKDFKCVKAIELASE